MSVGLDPLRRVHPPALGRIPEIPTGDEAPDVLSIAM